MVFLQLFIPEGFEPADHDLQASPGKLPDDLRVTCRNIRADVHDESLFDAFFNDAVEQPVHEIMIHHGIGIGKAHHRVFINRFQLGDQALDCSLVIFSFKLGPD